MGMALLACLLDPTLQIPYRQKRPAQVILSGMGESCTSTLIIDRMRRRFKVKEANQDIRRSLIKRPSEKGSRTGAMQATWGVGELKELIIELHARAEFWSLSSSIRWVAARSKVRWRSGRGVKEAMETGVTAGYPMLEPLRVSVTDGSYRKELDSSEMAFKIAASMTFKGSCAKATPIIKRATIMAVGGVVTPDQFHRKRRRRLELQLTGMIEGQNRATVQQWLSKPKCRCPRDVPVM